MFGLSGGAVQVVAVQAGRRVLRGRISSSWQALIVAAVGLAMAVPSVAQASVVYSWGRDHANFELGDGKSTNRDYPLPETGFDEVVSVSSGEDHGLSLMDNGSVDAWGANAVGQLGDGGTEASKTPVAVSGIHSAVAVAAGGSQSLALLGDGTVMAWGFNEHGQLGDGSTTSRDVPVPVSGLSEVKALATGGQHSLALLADGTVVAWGENTEGQLGNGTTVASDVPVPVSGLSEVVAVAAGQDYSLALLADGEVRSWGYNGNDELGDGSSMRYRDVPVAVSGLTHVTQIAAGGQHALALLEDGTVESWGAGYWGQLGNGRKGFEGGFEEYESIERATPGPVSGLSDVVAVAAGSEDSFALRSDGAVEAWGSNRYDELGDGDRGPETSSDLPVPVACGLNDITSIAAGGDAAFALGTASDHACPIVNGVSPAEGPVNAQTSVTITGSGFSGASAVHVGAVPAVSFTVKSPTTITAVVPESAGRAAGPRAVTVTTASSGTTPEGSEGTFTYRSTLEVKGVSPHAGGQAGGTSVTIVGTNFNGVSAVDFGASAAQSYTVISATKIQAVAPPGSGSQDITVATGEGVSEAQPTDRYTYEDLPEFGRCISPFAPPGLGAAFGSKSCSGPGSKDDWEWFPLTTDPPEALSFTTAASSVLLRSVKELVTCTGESGEGEYTNTKTLLLTGLNLTGCHTTSGSCQSAGQPAEHVETGPLRGTLGIVKANAGAPAKDKLGIQIESLGGELFAEFSCAGVPISVRGATVFAITGNKMRAVNTWAAQVNNKGIEKYTRLTGGPEAVLQMQIGSSTYEAASLAASIRQTNASEVEANSAA